MGNVTGRVMLAAAAAMMAALLLAAGFVGMAAQLPSLPSLSLAPGAAPSPLRRLSGRVLLPPLAAWDRADALLDRHRPAADGAPRRDPRPLRAQAAEMEADLRRRFVTRDGRFFLASTPPVETSDLCLWQGVYAALTALDFSREPSDARRRRAERAVDGLVVLAERGRPLARSVLPLGVRAEPAGPFGRRDARWQWKEDASVDSAAGWVFGMVVAVELLPTRREKALDALQRYADELAAGGFRLRNSDGTLTRYGAVGGAVVNSPTGLLTTLAALRLLARHGRGQRFAQEHRVFVDEGQDLWAAYATAPFSWLNVTTNHNIAVLGLTAALLAEDDPVRAERYARGLLRVETLTRKMGDSFWIYLTDWALARRPASVAGLEGSAALSRHRALQRELLASARASLRQWQYPFNKLKQHREGPAAGSRPVPVYDRPAADFVWQRSPYAASGWQGARMSRSQGQAYAPLDFLITYSLGRSIGALAPNE